MKKLTKRALCLIATLLLSLFTVFESTLSIFVKAEETATEEITVKDYAQTDILDDLSDIDVEKYPKDEDGNPQAIRFQEYCYSEKAFFAEYYGLYVYIYNPTETPLMETENASHINMAVEYDEDGDPTAWANQGLTYLDKTENCRFYKFKVTDSAAFRPIVGAYLTAHDGVRRYDIADIDLKRTDGQFNKSTNYSKTYRFTGFGAGCGETTASQSTLSCTVEGLETIELNVKHANYRSEKYVDNVCDELNTVGFAVDEKYFTNYGGLQEIQAEWYEYKTSPIFVTSDEGFCEAVASYIGQNIGNYTEELGWCVLWDWIDELSSTTSDDLGFVHSVYCRYFLNAYNGQAGYDLSNVSSGNDTYLQSVSDEVQSVSRLDWVIEAKGEGGCGDYIVSSERLKDWIAFYTEKFPDQAKVANKYAENLFTDSIDEARIELLENPEDKRGYMNLHISATDDRSLFLPDSEQSAFSKWFFGTDYEEESLNAIEVLTAADVAGLKYEDFCKKYTLAESDDSQKVFNDCIAATNAGNRYVLFRHSVTDYYSERAYFEYLSNSSFTDQDGYVAQQTVFLDFDIISLKFETENGNQTVIAVCSTPIDIINAVTPAPDASGKNDPTDWLEYLGRIILFAVVLFLGIFVLSLLWNPLWSILSAVFGWLFSILWKVLSFVLKWLWKAFVFVLCFPFNVIGWIVKGVKKRKAAKDSESPPKTD